MAQPETPPPAPTPKRRRWKLPTLVVLVAVVYFLPWILAATPLRNGILKLFLPGPPIRTCESASLDWFSPVVFRGIHMSTPDGATNVVVPEYRSNQPFYVFAFLRSGDLGTITIDQPFVRAVVDSDKILKAPPSPPKPKTAPPPTLIVAVDVKGLEVAIESPKPGVAPARIDDVSVRAYLRRGESGQQLVSVDPGKILDNVELTPLLGDVAMKYVTPVLADAAWIRGRISVDVNNCQLDLANPLGGEVKGRITIHEVEAGGSSPIIKTIGQIAEMIFPGRVPKSVRLASNSSIEFEMADGGVYHHNVVFGLPDVSPDMYLRSEGFIGFDQSINLAIEVPLTFKTNSGKPLIERLHGQSLKFAIKGTIEKPKLDASSFGANGMQMVQKLLEGLSVERIDSTNPRPAGQPGVEVDATQAAAEALRGLGVLIQERQARRKEKAAAKPAPTTESPKPAAPNSSTPKSAPPPNPAPAPKVERTPQAERPPKPEPERKLGKTLRKLGKAGKRLLEAAEDALAPPPEETAKPPAPNP